MTAIPLARFLVEFGSDGDHRADGLRQDIRPNAAWMADANARVAESHAQGHAEGRAAAEAEFAAKLETQRKDFEQELAMARQCWAATEGNALSETFLHALQDLETRLAGTMARILRPFVETEIRRAAIDELVTTIETILSRDEIAKIEVSGPVDLLCVLRVKLAGKIPATFVANEACDVRVAIEQTILETQLGAWIGAIEKAAQ